MPSIDLAMPEEIHAIAFETYAVYAEEPKGLSDESTKGVLDKLLGLSADLQALWYASASLGALALTLEAEGDIEAANQVRNIVQKQAPHFRPILEELQSEASEGHKAKSAAFQEVFGDGGPRKRAPKHGEAPPAGTVSLKSLMPQGGLPGQPIGRRPAKGRTKNPDEAGPPRPGPGASPARRPRIDLQPPGGPKGPKPR